MNSCPPALLDTFPASLPCVPSARKLLSPGPCKAQTKPALTSVVVNSATTPLCAPYRFQTCPQPLIFKPQLLLTKRVQRRHSGTRLVVRDDSSALIIENGIHCAAQPNNFLDRMQTLFPPQLFPDAALDRYSDNRPCFPMPSKSSKVSPAQFVRVWCSSSSAAEAAATLGISEGAARSRATLYRQRGLHRLKHMPAGRPRIDVSELNTLIK